MNKISIVAHRGGSALNGENSLQAFARAIELGVDGVECDVHMMQDGKIVVFHDLDLQQLTGERGKITEIDDTRRESLRLYGTHTPPPLLEELACLLAPTKVRLHIEIKAQGNMVLGYEIATKSCAILREYNLLEKTSAISFEAMSLVPFIEAGVPSGPCVSAPDAFSPKEWSQRIENWQRGLFRDLSLNGNRTPPEFVHAAREAGFTVGVWTINGPARLAYWLQHDVDYITTDQPDLALSLRS